jgi:cytoskeletal protein RodZ
MKPRQTDIGSRLRQAREQRGLALQDIADATKLSMFVLKAIERNDFSLLPGGIFTRGYLRAFAHEVGLSPDEIVDEYRMQFDAPPAPPLPPRRNRYDEDNPLHQLAIAVFCVGFLISGWWLWTPSEAPPAPSEVAAVGTGVELDAVEDVTIATALAPSASDAPIRQSMSGEPILQLEIRPVALCWVSATADGQLAIRRLMQPGEHAVVDARERIVMRVGDAEACAYSINGAPGRRLGEAEKAVTVHIEADNYHNFLAQPVSSAPEVHAISVPGHHT